MTATSGSVASASRERSGKVGRLAADLQVLLASDADGERLAHGRVVIDDQNSAAGARLP